MSPWHDLEADANNDNEYCVTGVTENVRGCDMIISCRKDLEHNPLVQEVCDNGKPLIYGEKLVFNKSFIPQTWVSDE